MDREKTKARLEGCYIAIPTLFRDNDLELNLPGIRKHIRFLLNGGIKEGNAVLLACGAAGDFSTLTTEERRRVTEAILEEAGGKVGVILGAQSTDQREVVTLVRAAAKMGAVAVQLSPPFYHTHTDEDTYEFIAAAAGAADVGVVFYTTFWLGKITLELLGRLAEIPNVVGLKWAAPDTYQYEMGLRRFGHRFCVIDNQFQFVMNHMLGGRGVNTHPSNYWPEWGVRFWGLLEAKQYKEAQQEVTRVVSPYYDLCYEVAAFTGGEGHLDKLCLELVGLDSSRNRPPIRDIRPKFREKARQFLKKCGVPHCK